MVRRPRYPVFYNEEEETEEEDANINPWSLLGVEDSRRVM